MREPPARQRADDCIEQQLGIGQRGERHEGDAAGSRPPLPPPRAAQAGLADAAGADQGQQAHVGPGEQLAHARHLLPAPDQRRELGWQG
ncbi:MAG: hypothetical protein U0841_05070 [Chloroflexia bacterium]